MKTALKVVALIFMIVASVRAENTAPMNAAALNDKLNQLQSLTNQIKSLDDNTGKALEARKRNLSDTADLLNGAVEHLQQKYTDLQQRINTNTAKIDELQPEIDTVAAQIAGHNARCNGSSDDEGFVAACNAEAANLNAQRDRLEAQAEPISRERDSLLKESQDLDSYKDGLKQRFDQMSQDTLDWAAGVKKYNSDRNDLLARAKQALIEVKQLANSLQGCIDRLPRDADDAQIKHTCGNIQFDGVRENLQRLRDIDPGTIMPGVDPAN